jgi:predicted RNA-binding Zn-ribbon protein involved in translation (DUF1610 family)
MSEFKSFPEHLACPHCGSIYLHLNHVTIKARNGEDNDYGLDMVVNVEQAKYTCSTYVNNFSGRRDATSLKFYCEDCGKASILTFHQHKGFTCIE